MVSFKKLFFATSLLLSGVAAAPSPAGTLNVAAAEVRAVNDFAVESRDLNIEDTTDARPRTRLPTKRNVLERRILHAGSNAKKVDEGEFVTALQINSNGGEATVINLTGCTALFFYMPTHADLQLRRAVHILCGHELSDAKAAAQATEGATSVYIRANTQTYLEDAKKGIMEGRPSITDANIHTELYSLNGVLAGNAVTFTGSKGGIITKGTGPKTGGQPQ